MNFMDVQLSTDGKSVNMPGDVNLPLTNGSVPEHGGKDVILGIRPEHFELAQNKADIMNFRVDHVELLAPTR